MTDYIVDKAFSKILTTVNAQYLKAALAKVEVGDLIKVGLLIKEGNKERTQYYNGVIVARKNKSISLSIGVRRILQGIGIEKTFTLHCPKVVFLDIKASSRVRRAKLYYLRHLAGKASRLKQRFD